MRTFVEAVVLGLVVTVVAYAATYLVKALFDAMMTGG